MIDLASYDPNAAAAASKIAVHFPAAFSIAGVDAEAVMPGKEVPGILAKYRRVAARLEDHDIRLTIDPALLPPAALAQWPEISATPMDDALRDILFDIVLRDVAVLVEQWCGHRPDWSVADAAILPYGVLLLRRDRADRPVGLVEFDTDGLEWLAARCATLPRHLALVDDVPMLFHLQLDRVSLAADALRALGRGDVILLDGTPVSSDGEIAVLVRIARDLTFRAAIVAGRLTFVSIVDCQMSNPDALPPSTLDELTVPVDFIVGCLALPLGRLRELAVGQVLDLGVDATTNVSLRINGQIVAIGELVRLSERTGVRILDVRLRRVSDE